jgi:high-affinity iron transporter
MLLVLLAGAVSADEKSWDDLAGDVEAAVTRSYETYIQGDFETAKLQLDDALAMIPEEKLPNMQGWFEAVAFDMDEGRTGEDVWQGISILIEQLYAKEDTGGARKDYKTWAAIIADMDSTLAASYNAYTEKNVKAAKDLVNDAYFGFYEKYGVERATLSYISGKRASTVEYQFSIIKKAMTDGKSNAEVKEEVDKLITWLHEDATDLDGRQIGALSIFVAALLIMLREGVEAILVIAAIVAYLIRSGNGGYSKTVYIGSALAVLASAAAAFAITKIVAISGAPQEIMEGLAMLTAVVVLFFVSNWMVSKSSGEAWKGYVEGKVKSAVTKGSAFALAFAAFLAVFREGAEVILFFQALFADSNNNENMIWLGFAVGCVVLVFIFLIIRFGSLKLPLKPFFIGTSILMYIICVAFAGGGIKELQEAGVIGVTNIPLIPTMDILGIYPTLETFIPQIALLALAVFSFVFYMKKSNTVKAA